MKARKTHETVDRVFNVDNDWTRGEYLGTCGLRAQCARRQRGASQTGVLRPLPNSRLASLRLPLPANPTNNGITTKALPCRARMSTLLDHAGYYARRPQSLAPESQQQPQHTLCFHGTRSPPPSAAMPEHPRTAPSMPRNPNRKTLSVNAQAQAPQSPHDSLQTHRHGARHVVPEFGGS